MIFSVLTERQRADFEKALELDFALQVDGVGRLLGNVHFNRGTLQAASRLTAGEVPSITELVLRKCYAICAKG